MTVEMVQPISSTNKNRLPCSGLRRSLSVSDYRFPALLSPPLQSVFISNICACLVVLGVVLAQSLGVAGQAQDHSYTDQEGDVAYTVTVPAYCSSHPCGMIVDVHGGTMNADKQDQETNMRFLGKHAPEHGAPSPYIVLQPELQRNDFRWSREDLQQILNYINKLTNRYDIIAHDRHFGGFSQGGVMAAWLLCDGNRFFTSYSAIAGGAEELQQCLDDKVSLSAPLLYIHGREDRVMPFVHAQSLSETVEADQGLGWAVEFYFHELRGGPAGAHCVPGGQGRFGCGEQSAGKQILEFYIAQSRRLQLSAS